MTSSGSARSRKASPNGFTLIELLVVIAIVAILAAILFPVFVQAKLAAKGAVCIANMKQLGTAFATYMGDSDGNYPASYGNRPQSAAWVLSGKGRLTGTTSPPCPIPTGDGTDLCSIADPTRGSLWSYTKNEAIYRCPVDQTGPYRWGGYALSSQKQRVTYTMNIGLMISGMFPLPNGGVTYIGMSETQVTFPSTTYMLIDEDVETRNDGSFSGSWTGALTGDDFGRQHADGANLLHADTSLRRYPKKAFARGSKYWRRFNAVREED